MKKMLNVALSFALVTVAGTGSAQTVTQVNGAGDLDLVGGLDRAGFIHKYGDLNQDGEVDLVVGAPRGAGVVRVYFGPLEAGDPIEAETADVVLYGDTNDELGWAIAVDDLDGDGYDDLAVSAAGRPVSLLSYGTVFVLKGPLNTGADVVDNVADVVVTPSGGGTYLGWDLVTSDVDGDGDRELVMSDTALTTASTVWVMEGLSHPAVDLFYPPSEITRVDVAGGYGGAMAAGDFNGDGFDDLALGGFLESFGDADGAGGVSLVYGSSSFFGEEHNFRDEEQDGDVVFAGHRTFGRLGHSLALFDLNHDGFDDLVVGAPSMVDVGSYPNQLTGDPGEVFIVQGRKQLLSATIDILSVDNSVRIVGSPDDRFGFSVSAGVRGGTQAALQSRLAVGAPRAQEAWLFDAPLGNGIHAPCLPPTLQINCQGGTYPQTTLSTTNASSVLVDQAPASYFGFDVTLAPVGPWFTPTALVVGATHQLVFFETITGTSQSHLFFNP